MKPAMFRDTVIANLLAIAGAYCEATGKSLTTVSKDFYGRGDFFDKLKQREHTISVNRLSEMLDNFRKSWPKETPWPMTRPVFMTQKPPRR